MNIRDLLNRLDNIAEDGEVNQNALPNDAAKKAADDAAKKAAEAAIAKQLGVKKNGTETGEQKVSTTGAQSDINNTSTTEVDLKHDKEGRFGKPVPSGYYLDYYGNLRPDWDKYWDDTGVKKDATIDVKKQSAMPNEAPKVEVNGVGQAYPPEQVAAAKVIKGYVKTIEQCKEWETYVDPKTGAISYADRPHDGDPFKHVPHNMPMDWIPRYNPDLDKAIKAIPKIVIDKKGWFGNAYEHDIDLALLQKILASAPADTAPEVPKAPVNVEKKPVDDTTAKDELGDFAAQKLKDQEAREKAEADRIAKEKEKVEPEVAQTFPVKPQGDIETKELPPLDDKKQNALPSNAEKEAQIARAKKLKDMIDDYENKLHPPKESIEDLAKSLVESFGYDFVYDNLNEISGERAIVKPALKALIKATEEELRALTKTAEKYGGKAVDGVKGLWDDLSNAKEAAKTGYHGEPVPTGKTTKSGKPQMASQDSKAFQKELAKKSDLEKGAYKGGQTAKKVVNNVKDNPKPYAIGALTTANAGLGYTAYELWKKNHPNEEPPADIVAPKEEVPPVIDAPKEEVPPVIDAPKDNKDSKQNALPNNPSDEELAEMKAKIQKEIDELSKIEDPDVQEVVKPSKERWDKINEPKINRFTKKEK